MSNLTVVMYHYVRPIAKSRFPAIKGLELDDFKEQVAFIRKNYNPVSVDEVIASFHDGVDLPPNAILMTFDDAYSDHFKYAYPVLKKNGMQGLFYAPGKAIQENDVLDVNKIHFILASCADIERLIDDVRSLFELHSAEYQLKPFEEYYSELAVANRFDPKEVIFVKRFLQVALPEDLRGRICSALFDKYIGMSQEAFCSEIYMTKDQLTHMVSDGMHVGSHGYNHYWWNALEPSALEREIDQSIDFLKSIGAYNENWTACYPYGSSSDFVAKALSEKGCKLAFTTEVNVANSKKNDPLLVPRLDTNDLPKVADSAPNHWYR
ncbi:polysaccharide deacetylase family protein [Brucella sp. IR073]|uniref:polysaccharide deacetylase family protein n=1 Tax=unclassified Brucella TaxID=2632610 RepID=UPI003B97F35D